MRRFCRPSLRIRSPDLCWLTCYRFWLRCRHIRLLDVLALLWEVLICSARFILLRWIRSTVCVISSILFGGWWCDIVAPVLGSALIAGLCWLTYYWIWLFIHEIMVLAGLVWHFTCFFAFMIIRFFPRLIFVRDLASVWIIFSLFFFWQILCFCIGNACVLSEGRLEEFMIFASQNH